MTEEWRPCFGGVYSISSLGRVRRDVSRSSAKAGTILKPILVNGYHYVALCDRANRRRRSVHSLVADAFIGPRPSGFDINHKNAIKTDNAWTNLEYISHSDNVAHATRLGLCTGGTAHGEQQGSAKLTEADVRVIRAARAEGETLASIAQRFRVTIGAIHHIVKRLSWRHVA